MNIDEGRSRIEAALATATAALLAELTPDGHWEGELSSSALSTATAIVALGAVDRERYADLIADGRRWLTGHVNADGGWGDTVLSKSNISTTALCWAALAAGGEKEDHRAVIESAWDWLERASGEVPGSALVPSAGFGVSPERTSFTVHPATGASSSPNVYESSSRRDASTGTRDERAPRNLVPAIVARYGKDRTFSVPILMHLAVCGRVDWQVIPALPFELAALPHQLFGAMQLPVVSYALPALIAIGQAIHYHAPSRFFVARTIREQAKQKTLRVLTSIQPENGGFLEATPLTSFVTMALASSGEAAHPVVRKGVEFLQASVRPDGSWPIDTNLATWVSTMAIKALAPVPGALIPEQRLTLREWLLAQQYRVEHPYTHTAPGGWAWTPLPGGVPDADDTPGALLALTALGVIDGPARVAGLVGCRWLMSLQNRDGGIPTFCRGWGALPFDRSSPDLTAHTLRAWQIWRTQFPDAEKPRLDAAQRRASSFLNKVQRPDGSWLPLWFGNEHAPDDINPLYGTAHVVLALRDLPEGDPEALRRGIAWLADAQNEDGGWGGVKGAPSTTEETALAVEALAGTAKTGAVDRGAAWLVERVEGGTWREPSPIGFYFAKLWYYEKLYPLIWTVGALSRALAPVGR